MADDLAPEEKTVTLSVRVKPSLLQELKAIAKQERRTVSQLANFAVEEWIERHRRRKGARG
jgi:predicted transcriptional regulator